MTILVLVCIHNHLLPGPISVPFVFSQSRPPPAMGFTCWVFLAVSGPSWIGLL